MPAAHPSREPTTIDLHGSIPPKETATIGGCECHARFGSACSPLPLVVWCSEIERGGALLEADPAIHDLARQRRNFHRELEASQDEVALAVLILLDHVGRHRDGHGGAEDATASHVSRTGTGGDLVDGLLHLLDAGADQPLVDDGGAALGLDGGTERDPHGREIDEETHSAFLSFVSSRERAPA